EKLFFLGCSYYLMQDSFFTTSVNYRNLLNQGSRTCLLRYFWYNNV
ncbi:hypothetical protein A5827_001116, partial [Enterococcus faecium]